MPRIKKKKKTATILLAVVIAMSGAGLAFAYWTSGGSGSGTGATGTSQSVVIVQTTELNAMGPGVAAQSLSGTSTTPVRLLPRSPPSRPRLAASPVRTSELAVAKLTTTSSRAPLR